MITCNRCGKENQDHYKFCLGCGNEIKVAVTPTPAATPLAPLSVGKGLDAGMPPLDFGDGLAPPPNLDDLPAFGSAPTMIPPDPAGVGPTPRAPHLAADLPGMSPRAAGASPAVKPSGGIPWNDSPKMPTPVTTSPAASSFDGPAPKTTAGAANPLLSMATPLPVTPPPVTPPPASTPIAAVPLAKMAVTKCPSCGADVKAGFAFCGVCGSRVAPADGVSGQRTMYMAAPAEAAAPRPRGQLVLIRPDGSEGGTHPLHDGENLIGRGQAALFDTDAYLSPRHAEFSVGAGGVVVRDLRSLNGVFVKIGTEEELQSGDIFRIGQELLRFDVISPPAPLEDGTEIMGTPNPGFWGRLSVIVGRDVDGSAFPIFGDALVLGRERGDILFPEDGYVSGTHARISLRDGHVYLADLGSSNGTFLRLKGERTITAGSFVLMGQQLFRTEIK